MRKIFSLSVGSALLLTFPAWAEMPSEVRVGMAGHAFDSSGVGDQAEAAAAIGATILYVGGFGSDGYSGLPTPELFARRRQNRAAYVRHAKSLGIRLALGYLCATSIVKLETFDQNWPPELRSQFHTPAAQWRQQDRNGQPLPSWYGGDYQPACMNNPDWRSYEKFMVRQSLGIGLDGIFFDNPIVHLQGCYCSHCMEKFARFLQGEGLLSNLNLELSTNSPAAFRQLALQRTNDFLRFRATIAGDFLSEMRTYARTINRHALVTCNNSLNSADAFYSQCRSSGINIYDLSQVEDFVVIEDMTSQPRVLATGQTAQVGFVESGQPRILTNGQTIEYTPTYKQLHAVSHGKPVVATTLASGDYTTAPNLVRLAMAEAAANNAFYLSWPTWPETQRSRMIAAIHPQADLLRAQERLLNDTHGRRDAVLFLPFRRWTETNNCAVSQLAATLTRANVQYEVLSEANFTSAELKGVRVVAVEKLSVFNSKEQAVIQKFQRQGGRAIPADQADWLKELQQAIGQPSVVLHGPATLRVIVRDQGKRTIVHLLNLNVQRLSSFEDKVTPALHAHLTCRVPFARVKSMRALTADAGATTGALPFTMRHDGTGAVVETTIPRLDIATVVVIER
ncbi:MAG: hypothetical protein HY298_17450 [Verrucomicrobia bacterium]|nr:hypothetical protein [Verrucomicrobiota bacterium]